MLAYLTEYNLATDSIESVVNDFMNVTIEELCLGKNGANNIEILTMELVRREKIFESVLDDMNYMELLTLLELSKAEDYLAKYNDDSLCTPERFYLFLYKYLLLILINADGVVKNVSRLLDTPLNTFIEHMDEMMQYNKKELAEYSKWVSQNFMESLYRLHKDIDIKATTIRELLKEIKKQVFSDWKIMNMSINEFQQKIFDELGVFKTLFGDFFMMSFPELINTEKFMQKYSYQDKIFKIDYNKKLRNLCHDMGFEQYGNEYAEKYKPMVDEELKYIALIQNGAKDILKMSEFMKNVIAYYERTYGKAVYGFRGAVNSSMVAYLCGITDTPPKDFYAWANWAGAEKCILDVNMPFNMYEKIYSYFNVNIPSCVSLHSCLDLSIFAIMKKPLVEYSFKKSEKVLEKFWGSAFGEENRLDYVYYWNQKHVSESKEIFEYLREKDLLPKNKDELVKLVGFLFATFEGEDSYHFELIKSYGDDLYDKMISTPEDIYDELIENGTDSEHAIDIALTLKERSFSKAQCVEISNNILHMMKLMNEEFEEYREMHKIFVG